MMSLESSHGQQHRSNLICIHMFQHFILIVMGDHWRLLSKGIIWSD